MEEEYPANAHHNCGAFEYKPDGSNKGKYDEILTTGNSLKADIVDMFKSTPMLDMKDEPKTPPQSPDSAAESKLSELAGSDKVVPYSEFKQEEVRHLRNARLKRYKEILESDEFQ